MGVDSGLPDFRGTQGFWKAYPPIAKLKLRFEEMANPRWFADDPEFAWGFYGHRLNLYRETAPHEGFSILREWGDSKKGGAFVYTSNVDGHFQQAGFEENQVLEREGIKQVEPTNDTLVEGNIQFEVEDEANPKEAVWKSFFHFK